MINREIGNLEYRRKLVKAGVVIVFMGILFCLARAIHNKYMPMITLKVENQSVMQGEELPAIQASVLCKGNPATILDRQSNYTVEKFLDDLKAEKGYRIQHEINPEVDGVYAVSVIVDKKLKEKLQGDWHRKVKFQVQDGTFEVQNQYGEWEKDKFKKWDGTYVISDFVKSKGSIYYFDKEGKMVTGEQMIRKRKYVFRKNGTMEYAEKKVDPQKPMIALTFDDGPGKYTDTLLATLDSYDARATFFMLGANAAKYPETIERMEAIGCELGNHSMNHANLVKLILPEYAEIDAAQAAISQAVGHGADVLRPPYGSVDGKVLGEAGIPSIMWSLDTKDWKRKDAVKISEYVLNYVSDGDIVLMHDIHGFSVDAANILIPTLLERGYQLVTVSELAEARGIELEKGEKYFHFYAN